MIAFKFILLVFCVFVGYTLGYLFTETKYRLAQIPIFKFEAFECRQCLSFHIAWVSSTLISLILNDWCMLLIGLFFAIMLFFGLKIDQKKKTIILENIDLTK